MRVSEKFVALSHHDIHVRRNIDTLKSIQVICAITRLDFIIIPVFSWNKYIYSRAGTGVFKPLPSGAELKYRRLHTLILGKKIRQINMSNLNEEFLVSC